MSRRQHAAAKRAGPDRSAEALDARAAALLRRAGIRTTAVRIAVTVAVLSHGKPGMEAQELAQRVVLEKRPVSVASLYRVLRELQEAGILIRRELPSTRVWYELPR